MLRCNGSISREVAFENDQRVLCVCFRPQVVRERMLCYAIIGRAGGKELIMKVNVNCEFISPLLEFSSDKVFFRVDKVGIPCCHLV